MATHTTDLTETRIKDILRPLDRKLLRPQISNQTRTGIPDVRVH